MLDREAMAVRYGLRGILGLSGVTGAMLIAQPAAGQADVTATWDGATGNWSDASHWDSASAPDNNGTTYDAVVNAGQLSLDIDPTLIDLVLNGGEIVGPGVLTIEGEFSLSRGTVRDLTLDLTAGTTNFSNRSDNILENVTIVGGDLVLGESGSATIRNGIDLSGNVLQMGSAVSFDGDQSFDGAIDGTSKTSETLSVNPGATLTLAPTAQVNEVYYFAGSGTLVNQGTIESSLQEIYLTTRNTINYGLISTTNQDIHVSINSSVGGFTNHGTLAVHGPDALGHFQNAPTNVSGSALIGGQWIATDGAEIDLDRTADPLSLATLEADVTLDGPAAVFADVDTVTHIGSSGAFRFLGGRNFTAVDAFTNEGVLELGGGTFDAPAFTNAIGGTILGHGVVAPMFSNSGSVQARGGVLTLSQGYSGEAETLAVEPDGVLDLAGASGGLQTQVLDHQGTAADSLRLGGNDISVSSDYRNASTGLGNNYDARANVTGTGEILATGDVVQHLTGDVADGQTPTPTVQFGDRHVGDTATASVRVANGGTTGPALRGAVQNTGLTPRGRLQ